MPPRTSGQSKRCASVARTMPNAEVSGADSATIEWAAMPVNNARAAASRKTSRGSIVAGASDGSPNRASRSGWRGNRTGGPRTWSARRSHSRASGPSSPAHAGPSRPSPSTVASSEWWRSTARSGRSRCAKATGGCTHSTPWRARSTDRKKGDPAASGTTVLHRSWRKPGSVSSLVRIPPPNVSAASMTCTDRPARASSIAAASPFGPEPTTTASRPREREPGPVTPVGRSVAATSGRVLAASRSSSPPRPCDGCSGHDATGDGCRHTGAR